MVNSLEHKRVLLTDFTLENEKDRQILRALLDQKALVFVFVNEFSDLVKLTETFPQVLPLLTNYRKDGEGQSLIKIISTLPMLSHIFNSAGEPFMKIFEKTTFSYKFKIEEIRGNNWEPGEIVKKMVDAGNTCLLINIPALKLATNLSEGIKEKVLSSLNESKRSFRRMFSLGSSGSSSDGYKNKPLSASTSAPPIMSSRGSQPTVSKHRESQQRTIQQENEKITKVIRKVLEKSKKKHSETEKNIQKKKEAKQQNLLKNIQIEKKREKNQLLKMNEEANVQTLSRSQALSADTANRIVASRASRVEKEVDRTANKKLQEGSEKIILEMTEVEKEMRDKHYQYVIDKQVKKLKEFQQKYAKS